MTWRFLNVSKELSDTYIEKKIDFKFSYFPFSVRSGSKHNLRTAISAENLKMSNKTEDSNNSNSSNVFLVCNSNNNSSLVKCKAGNGQSCQAAVQNSSSGVSSNNSCDSCSSTTASPPDTDSSSNHEEEQQQQQLTGTESEAAKSIVRVGPDGSASVVINATSGLVVNGPPVTSAGGGRTQRSRKFKKEVKPGAMGNFILFSSFDILARLDFVFFLGEFSNRCTKCGDRPDVKFHGLKCTRGRLANSTESMEMARLKSELASLTSDLERARKIIVELQDKEERWEVKKVRIMEWF